VTFPLLGEPMALDLVNTVVRVGQQDEQDLLADQDGFEAWWSAQLERLAPTPARSQQLVAAAGELLALRSAVRQLLDTVGQEEAPPGGALERVNRLAAHGAPQIAWATPRPVLTTRASTRNPLLVAVAVSAVDLLTGPQDAVRSCAHPACTLLFHDPAGRRQWCSAATCGNRARAARHYARHHPR